MIGISPIMIAHAVCAFCCIYGFHLVGTSRARLGYLLSGIGSVGWMLFAPSVFFMAQSVFFLWVSARGYERCSKPS